MDYTKFEQYLIGQGLAPSFVSLCLKRADTIERAYGEDIGSLVCNDMCMDQTLRNLEWKVEKNDLDNYQNVLRHYYKMMHRQDFSGKNYGNRRLK